jgi:OmcA/MtrC family decaheme c-type cytochrome
VAAAFALTACKGDRGPAGPAGPSGTSATPSPTGGGGLALTITGASITADGHPQIGFTLADAAGNPASATNVSFNWTIAWLGTDATSGLGAYQAYMLSPVTGTAPGGRMGTTQQPTAESGTAGTLTDQGGGKFQYTFKFALPSGYAASATHRVGVWASRPITGTGGTTGIPAENDIVNGVFDFVPAGGTPTTRDLTATQNCNACHGILQAHGGFRRDVRLCVTCHTTQLVDPDTSDTNDPTQLNPLTFSTLVHRVHRGANLPTVKLALSAANATQDPDARAWEYHVIGFRNGDNVYASIVADPLTYSALQPPPTAPTKFANAGVVFPQDFGYMRNCTMCHQQAKDASGTVIGGQDAAQYQTSFSRRTCSSCHDATWFGDPAALPKFHQAHHGGQQTADTTCTACHQVSFPAQHVDTWSDPAASPLMVTIKALQNTAPGGNPTVVYDVTFAKTGKPLPDLTPATLTPANVSLANVGRIAFTISAIGPFPDGSGADFTYAATCSQQLNLATLPTRQGDGFFHFTFANRSGDPSQPFVAGAAGNAGASAGCPVIPVAGGTPLTAVIPTGATGTWAVGAEGRTNNTKLLSQEQNIVTLAPYHTGTLTGSGATQSFEEPFQANDIKYFAPGSDVNTGTPRRNPVATTHCNVCHQHLAVHGANRVSAEYCIVCHTPDNFDVTRILGGRQLPATLLGDPSKTIDALPARAITLKVMIHQIHTGENLDVNRPLYLYAFGGFLTQFGDVRFPGTTAQCAKCHGAPAAGQAPTFALDSVPGNAAGTTYHVVANGPSGSGTTNPGPSLVGPMGSACLSCHDHADSAAHVQAMTVGGFSIPPALASGPQSPFTYVIPPTESCTVCHQESAQFSVSSVHAPIATGLRE